MPSRLPTDRKIKAAFCAGELRQLDLVISGSSTGGAAYAFRAIQVANKYNLGVVNIGIEWGAHQTQVRETVKRQLREIDSASDGGLKASYHVYEIDIDG